MTYWRMQLHPFEPKIAVQHTVTSLAAGFIGLDFGKDVGNLLLVRKDQLPGAQQDFWGFAHEMKTGDLVLIIAHNLPFALAKVAGPYSYMRNPKKYLGVWFKHFRPVKDVAYYADWITNPRAWKQIAMLDTLSRLNDESSKSYQLIEQWLRAR